MAGDAPLMLEDRIEQRREVAVSLAAEDRRRHAERALTRMRDREPDDSGREEGCDERIEREGGSDDPGTGPAHMSRSRRQHHVVDGDSDAAALIDRLVDPLFWAIKTPEEFDERGQRSVVFVDHRQRPGRRRSLSSFERLVRIGQIPFVVDVREPGRKHHARSRRCPRWADARGRRGLGRFGRRNCRRAHGFATRYHIGRQPALVDEDLDRHRAARYARQYVAHRQLP